jgi:preprotein translocase subunit SecG
MGFGASFGGGTTDLFGTSTAQVLKKFTAVLSSLFLIMSVLLSIWTSTLARQKINTPPAQIEVAPDVQ